MNLWENVDVMNLWENVDVWTKLDALRNYTDALYRATENMDPSAALGQMGALVALLPFITTDLVDMGVEAGMTQKRMAGLLDVPPSYLAGARKGIRS